MSFGSSLYFKTLNDDYPFLICQIIDFLNLHSFLFAHPKQCIIFVIGFEHLYIIMVSATEKHKSEKLAGLLPTIIGTTIAECLQTLKKSKGMNAFLCHLSSSPVMGCNENSSFVSHFESKIFNCSVLRYDFLQGETFNL